MTNAMVLERTSSLVMPTHYVELDSEEMSYVTGGEVISLSQLYSDQALLLANGIVWSANAVAASAAAGLACGIPIFGWAIAAPLFALAAACAIAASLFFTGYGNACNAINSIKHYEAMGRAYTIYRYVSGGIYSYIVE